MFPGVDEKLERARYFLENIKALAEAEGGIAHIPADKQQHFRANLDGFFFEIISAKDFFLQGINDEYGLELPREKATNIDSLKRKLGDKDENVLKVVTKIGDLLNKNKLQPEQKLRDDKGSWLWRLKNYRDSATHRELLRFHNITEGPLVKVKEGEEPQFQIVLNHETKVPSTLKRIDKQSIDYHFGDTRVYLFKDPEDPSQGHADVEVIPYCEQSLDRMSKFLKNLYSKLP